MRVVTSTGPLDTYCLSAEVQEYDAHPPIATFSMDYSPKRVDNDRLALAGYLLFRPWISGVLMLDATVTPALVQTIADVERPRWLNVQPVELYPRHVPHGHIHARATTLDQATASVMPFASVDGALELSILRSDQANGAIRTNGSVAIASNAFVFADDGDRQLEVSAAVTCLVAEDLGIGDLTIPSSGSEQTRGNVGRLLGAVGLVLRPPGD